MSPRRRYWRFVGLMSALGAAVALMGLLWLRLQGPPMPLAGRLAVGLGLWLTMVTAGALMGLAFLSSRTGHDEAADHRDED
jgi:hypothetical protein